MSEVWYINTGASKPIMLNFSLDVEDGCDGIDIYSIDINGNISDDPIASYTGYISAGQLSTGVSSGRAMVVFHSDESVSNDYGYNGFEMSFSTDNSLYVSDNMYVTGNVGIGTTTPIAKLDVAGKLHVSGDLYGSKVLTFQDDTRFYVTTSNIPNLTISPFSMPKYGIAAPNAGTAADLWLAGYNAIRMFTYGNPTPAVSILNNSYVGIGTIIPAQILDIEKNADYQLRMGNTAGQGYNIGRNGASGFLTFYGDQSGFTGYTFGGVNGTRMTINGSGNVGVGTTTPKAKIESVVGVNAYPATSGTIQNGSALRLRGGDNAILDFGMNSTNTWIQATDQNNLGLNYNLSLNPNGGYVGIGITNPTSNLHVYTQASSNPIHAMTVDVASFSTGDNSIVSDFFRVRDIGGGNTPFIIRGDGNVGIGNSVPGAKLDVAGEIKMQGRMGMYINDPAQCFTYDTDKTMGHYSLGWFNDSWNTGGPSLWMSGYGGMKFFTGGTPRLVIDGSGKVGIGTTTPDQALTVKGSIHANEVIVDVKGPIADYVFRPSYHLMSLHEVEQFVMINSHLPEIPSAGEITKNGLSMGEMQNKLLQKIEELTLYVIDQQKKIEELEQKLR